MKERPILFSAPMVRAILDGTKSQTRRVVKPQPEAAHDGEPYWFVGGYRAWTYRSTSDVLRKGGNPLPCPYGSPGDRLWCRETWARDDEDGALMYRADVGRDVCADAWEQGRIEGVARYRWRPSIHMPRWASRITLEVTDVRVQRLQEISTADCWAEGIPSSPDVDPVHQYMDLWESINGGGSWDANPWVWAVSFRRVTP